MENNDIILSEEVIETAEEIAKSSSTKGLMIAGGVGLVILSGVVAYKYVVKPMLLRIKSKKEQKESNNEDSNCIADDETEN